MYWIALQYYLWNIAALLPIQGIILRRSLFLYILSIFLYLRLAFHYFYTPHKVFFHESPNELPLLFVMTRMWQPQGFTLMSWLMEWYDRVVEIPFGHSKYGTCHKECCEGDFLVLRMFWDMMAIFMDYKNIFRVTLSLDLYFKRFLKFFKLDFAEKD